MSKVGKLPVSIPAGVTVSVDSGIVTVKGAKGELKQAVNNKVTVEVKGSLSQWEEDDSSIGGVTYE